MNKLKAISKGQNESHREKSGFSASFLREGHGIQTGLAQPLPFSVGGPRTGWDRDRVGRERRRTCPGRICFFEVDHSEIAFAQLKSNGLEKEISASKLKQRGTVSWKVFYLVVPDGLCYYLPPYQRIDTIRRFAGRIVINGYP
jgi:hypothetical protein